MTCLSAGPPSHTFFPVETLARVPCPSLWVFTCLIPRPAAVYPSDPFTLHSSASQTSSPASHWSPCPKQQHCHPQPGRPGQVRTPPASLSSRNRLQTISLCHLPLPWLPHCPCLCWLICILPVPIYGILRNLQVGLRSWAGALEPQGSFWSLGANAMVQWLSSQAVLRNQP